MDRETAKAYAVLDSAVADLPPTAPVQLSDAYIELVRRAVALPCNTPGADKSWVERSDRAFREYYRRVRLVR